MLRDFDPAISNLHPIYIHLYPAILFRWIFQYPWQETCQTLLSGSTPPRRPARTAAEAGEIRRAVADQWALSSILPCGMRTESGAMTAMMQKILDLYGSIGFSDRNLESKLAEHLCVQIEVSLLRRHHRPRNGGRCSAQHPRFCWYFFAYAAKTCEDSADKICFRVRD